MDKTEAIKIAQRYISHIKKKYVIEKAYLYGSYAKGTYHPDSDIDLALVFPHIPDIIDIQMDLMQMRNNEDLIIEPHPFRKKDFNLNHPVVAEILQEGIEIKNS